MYSMFICVYAYAPHASGCKETEANTKTHMEGGLEWFKDTGSVKKDRKQLWMAVPNKIDSALKIYMHSVAAL